MKRKDVIPFRKATAEEIERRVEMVEGLLGQLAKTGQIKTVMRKEFQIGARQAEEYISRARESIRKRLTQDKDSHRADSFIFYESMCAAGSAARSGDRIRARTRIDELLGLDAPKRQEISGPEGMPIQTETKTLAESMSDDELVKVVNQLRGMRVPPLGNGQTKIKGNGH